MIVVGIKNSTREVDQILSVSRDITSNKFAQQELLENRDKLRAALEVAKLGTAVINHEEGTIIFDDLASEILGVQAEVKLPKVAFEEGLSPQDREMFRNLSQDALLANEDAAFTAQWLYSTSNGDKWLNVRKRIVKVADNSIVRGIMAIQDITDLKQAEIESRDKHNLLRYTLSAANAGTWNLCVESNVIDWSLESYMLYGIPPSTEMNRDTWFSVVHHDDVNRLRERLDALVNSSENSFSEEFRIQHPEKGECWILCIAHIERHPMEEPIDCMALA